MTRVLMCNQNKINYLSRRQSSMTLSSTRYNYPSLLPGGPPAPLIHPSRPTHASHTVGSLPEQSPLFPVVHHLCSKQTLAIAACCQFVPLGLAGYHREVSKLGGLAKAGRLSLSGTHGLD